MLQMNVQRYEVHLGLDNEAKAYQKMRAQVGGALPPHSNLSIERIKHLPSQRKEGKQRGELHCIWVKCKCRTHVYTVLGM